MAETNQRNIHGGTFNSPFFLTPSVEDACCLRNPLHYGKVCVLADGVSRDKPGTLCAALFDHFTSVLEPVANQIGEPRQSAIINGTDLFGFLHTDFPFHQLCAQIWRVSNYCVGFRPDHGCTVWVYYGVTLLDRPQ